MKSVANHIIFFVSDIWCHWFCCRCLPREDILTVVECGCPNLLRKSVNSAKRLRAYLKIDEGDVSFSKFKHLWEVFLIIIYKSYRRINQHSTDLERFIWKLEHRNVEYISRFFGSFLYISISLLHFSIDFTILNIGFEMIFLVLFVFVMNNA